MKVKGAVASLLAATLIAVLATVTAAADTDASALALAAGAVAETGSFVSSRLANTEGTKDDPIVIRNLVGEKKQNKKKSKKMKKKGAKKAKKKKGAKKAKKKKKGAKKNKKNKKGAKKISPIKGRQSTSICTRQVGPRKPCPKISEPVICGAFSCKYSSQCVAGNFGWDATDCKLEKEKTITMNQLLLDAKKALRQKNLAKQELKKAGDKRKKANHTFKYKQKQYKKALKAIDKAKYKHPQWQNRADNALNKQIKALNDAK